MRWILVLLLLLIALLTAAATALRSASRLWLRDWVEQQLTGKVTAEAYLERLHDLLAASVSAAALVAILAGIAIGARPDENTLGTALAIVAFGLATLVLGQLLPRALGRRWSSRLVPVLLPTLRGTSALLSPVQRLASAVSAASVRPAVGEQSRREGFEELLREGQLEGQLEGIGERDELDIITGVVQFGERVLRDVMTPRTAVFAVDIALSPLEMAAVIASSGYSRVPVYRESLDEIVGVVHVFDVFRDGGERMAPLRPVPHAPATKRVSEMLFEMLRGQFHFAVVVDEFGGTAGIATLEDLLEELVGDIHDEHDEPAIADVGHSRHAVVLDASMPASEVAARFDAVLPEWVEDRAQPLAGLIVRALGRIPVVGERFVLGSLELTVVRATATRIQRLLAQRVQTAPAVALRAPQ